MSPSKSPNSAPPLAVRLAWPWCWSARTRLRAVYVRSKGKATRRSGHAELRAQAFRRHQRRRTARPGRPAQRRPGGRWHSRPASAARRRSTPTRSLPAIDPDKDVDGFNPVNAGRLAIGLPGFVPCTPLGCLKLLRAELGDLSRQGRSGGRPFEYRRQADGAAAAGRTLHRHHRPQPHPRPARALSAGRHRRRRGRAAGDGQGRLAEARRDRHRRRHQPHRR